METLEEFTVEAIIEAARDDQAPLRDRLVAVRTMLDYGVRPGGLSAVALRVSLENMSSGSVR